MSTLAALLEAPPPSVRVVIVWFVPLRSRVPPKTVVGALLIFPLPESWRRPALTPPVAPTVVLPV